jgi:hypothetical protein
METYFGGLLREQKTEREQKDADQARQLAAFHALLQHPDTPESEVPNILDSVAKMIKVDKDFAPVTAHMREGMKRRVPSGPEQETGQSRFNRMKERSSAEGMGLVPDLPAQEMYQPTAEYGSLTQAQAADSRNLSMYEAQQGIQTRKMLEQQAAMTDRAIQVESQKEIARQARLETEYKLKRDLLEPKERLAADKQRNQYEQSLLAQLGHAPSEEEKAWARAKSGEMVINLADAMLGQKAAAAEASRATAKNRLAQIKHWNNQDAHAIRMESITGLSAASARQFNMQTREVWPELSRVKSEILQLQKFKATIGPADTRYDAQLQDLEQRRDELQLQIKDARDALQSSSVPSSPQSAVRPDGKYHYTPDQIRRALRPGQSYESVLRQLQSRPNVVIDQ